MEITASNLSMLASLLTQSLSPDPATRHPAEKSLHAAEVQPGFLLLVLALVEGQGDAAAVGLDVRQAAGVYFKNAIKRRWGDEPAEAGAAAGGSGGGGISEFDRTAIKSRAVPVMVRLSEAGAQRLQAQVGEAVAEIAGADFPARWPGLVDDLVNSLSGDNFVVNNGVLATAHSIFGGWRAQFRTDDLFSTILLVLGKFTTPYFQLFQRVDALLSQPASAPLPAGCSPAELARALHLLLELFLDFTSQDLPEFFEDNAGVFLGAGEGVVVGPGGPVGEGAEYGFVGKYLRWTREDLMGEEDDDAPGPLQRVKAAVCEIAELFAQKYSDAFPQLGAYVRGVWEMLGGVGRGTRDDQLVGRALGFLSVVVKMGNHSALFAEESTLRAFCDSIILPNIAIRTHEEEMFEDDPMEYIRQDLEASIENDTRRQAASEFTRALLQHFEGPITQIIGAHVTSFLESYRANPSENWKAKDTAIYLLTSIASKGSTLQAGVTSTNALVDVVQFFSDNVFADLQASTDSVHPILQVDAIKYLYTFRNQLTKEQLVSVLPVLVAHLGSDNYVVYSYAAITIERILFVKQNGQLIFNQADVQPFAENILMACFRNIEKGTTPEKIAENDYLMKCVMRVIITARSGLAAHAQPILGKLVAIIGETSKNPSNPRFNQYSFESISALIRFVSASNPAAVSQFEEALFPPLQYMLVQDVTEFMPYAFQIISQMLELHPINELPSAYQQMTGPLSQATLWEQRGNVPALVRLWTALIPRGADSIVQSGQLQGLLGIFQKLLNAKSTEVYAFELLRSLYQYIPISAMQPFTQPVIMMTLQRLQAAKTPQLSQAFATWALFMCAIKQVGADFFVSALQAIQPGLMGNLMESVILLEVQRAPAKDRKTNIVGLTKLLTETDGLLQPTTITLWPQVLEAVLDAVVLPVELRDVKDDEVLELDPEDSSFQSAFSKLGASETKAADPVAEIADPQEFLSKQLAAKSASKPGILPPLMAQVPEKVAGPFAQYMRTQDHNIV